MRSNVKFVATKKGMSAALALAAYKNPELFSYSLERLTRAVGGLLQRPIATAKFATTSARKTSCVPLLACATCTISPAGRRAFCA